VLGVGLKKGINNFDGLVDIADGNERLNESDAFKEERGLGLKVFFRHQDKGQRLNLLYWLM
jgi:hypothetical protein